MENLDLSFNGPPNFAFLIGAEVAATGTISVPQTGFTQSFSVPAGQATEISLPQAIWYPMGSGVTDNKGIRIVANAPISVTAVHYRLYFTESSIVLPLEQLADEYIVLAAQDADLTHPSQFLIVATENNTQIDITPSSFTRDLRPAKVPYTISLNRGQVYQVQAANDLSGTVVKARNNKKIALFGGAKQADIYCVADDSHIYDQNYPIRLWDKEYVVIPFADQTGDVIKIVAATNDTQIRLNCQPLPRILNRGEHLTLLVSTPSLIEANQPVSVAQFSKSQSCNPLAGPNMLVLPPFIRFNRRAVFQSIGSFGDSSFQSYINIITKTSTTTSLTIDGSPPNVTWNVLSANPIYAYIQYPLEAGNHELVSSNGFYAFSYGFGPYDGYTHFLGYDEQQNIEMQSFFFVDLGRDTTLCPGQSLILNAATPEATAYRWSNGSVNASVEVKSPGRFEVEIFTPCTSGKGAIEITFENSNPGNLYLGSDTTLCAGESLQLNAAIPGAIGFLWQDGSTKPDFQVTEPGVYSVEVYSACKVNIGRIRVSYTDSIPLIFSLGTDTTLCTGQSLLLNAGTPGNRQYRWQDGSTASTFLVTAPGEYDVQVFSNCRVSSGKIRVNYLDLFQPHLGADTTLCPRQQLLLQLPASDASYQWQDGSTRNHFLVTQPGEYMVKVSNGPCTASDVIRVGFEAKLPIYENEEKVYACGNTLLLDAGEGLNGNVAYRWQDGSTTPTFQATVPGKYQVEVYNRCEKVTRPIQVHAIRPPNVYTPNGDEWNSCFVIPCIAPGEWSLSVYNRWGELVYHNERYANNWCGEQVANGLYYYLLSQTQPAACRLRGWVQVLR